METAKQGAVFLILPSPPVFSCCWFTATNGSSVVVSWKAIKDMHRAEDGKCNICADRSEKDDQVESPLTGLDVSSVRFLTERASGATFF